MLDLDVTYRYDLPVCTASWRDFNSEPVFKLLKRVRHELRELETQEKAWSCREFDKNPKAWIMANDELAVVIGTNNVYKKCETAITLENTVNGWEVIDVYLSSLTYNLVLPLLRDLGIITEKQAKWLRKSERRR